MGLIPWALLYRGFLARPYGSHPLTLQELPEHEREILRRGGGVGRKEGLEDVSDRVVVDCSKGSGANCGNEVHKPPRRCM